MRFNSQAEARRYIYKCLAETLDNDLHGSAAGYIYNEDLSERDQERLEAAAQKVLEELERKSKPRAHEPRRAYR